MQKLNWKRTAGSLAIVFLLTLLILLVFHQQREEIFSSLSAVSAGGLFLIMVLGTLSNVLDALAHRTLIQTSHVRLSVKRAVELIYLGLFSNVATLATGTVPLQSYYLHQCGMIAGAGMGTLLVEYSFHKTMVLLYAGVMLLSGRQWFRILHVGNGAYLLAGYGIAIAIIAFFTLLCCNRRIQSYLGKLIDRIPEKGSWIKRKVVWQSHLIALGRQSRHIFVQRHACIRSWVFTGCKLFVLYSIPFVCLRLLGNSTLTFWQAHLLSALMLLFTGAIPNIGGVGPTEAAFLLLFSPHLSQAAVLSALILYRIATYYIPFLLGTVVFFRWYRSVQPGMVPKEKQ